MDFEHTPEQRTRYADTLESVRVELGGHETASGPAAARTRWNAAAKLGLTGLCLPAEYGGGGLGALDTALCLEAFGRGCPDTGLVFAVCAHLLACGVPIRDFGSEATRERLLPGFADGTLVAANAITEDEAGSDTGRLAMTACREGEEYILDGVKSFASNAPISDVLVTYASTDPRAGFFGITAFAVPTGTAAVIVSEPLAKMGLEGCPAGRVRFQACRVPSACRLGDEGQGHAIFTHGMMWERGCLFAAYIGLMDAQLERCVAHARARRQFGRPIAGFQAISHRIATMKQRLESSRLLLYRACWMIDRIERNGARELAAAVAHGKVAVSEAAVANSLDAIQIFGGAGYLAQPGIERYLRDCVPTTLFSGTTEIQRELIAREAGL
jgi:L-prolyl-[peptidyl-carrier protein] dehydrogenase